MPPRKNAESWPPGSFLRPVLLRGAATRWYELTRHPDGTTISLMQKLPKKYQMVLVVPVYEVAMTGVYFNTRR